jgi:putative acetyltransferase
VGRGATAQGLAIRPEALGSAAARLLIAALNAELAALYPEPGSTHFKLDAADIAPANGVFLVGYLNTEAVACGAIRRIETGVAEVKRMYVAPDARGRGLSGAMLAALEAQARALGLTRLVLETGTRQPAALALYRRAGFKSIACFGAYVGSDLSVCMAKDLA